jgi:CHASE2 domain-containing sensor protein
MTTSPRWHRVCAISGLVLLAIALERLANMLLIGRPLDDFIVRAWVFRWTVSAGVVLLIVAVLIRRDR